MAIDDDFSQPTEETDEKKDPPALTAAQCSDWWLKALAAGPRFTMEERAFKASPENFVIADSTELIPSENPARLIMPPKPIAVDRSITLDAHPHGFTSTNVTRIPTDWPYVSREDMRREMNGTFPPKDRGPIVQFAPGDRAAVNAVCKRFVAVAKKLDVQPTFKSPQAPFGAGGVLTIREECSDASYELVDVLEAIVRRFEKIDRLLGLPLTKPIVPFVPDDCQEPGIAEAKDLPI